MLLDALEIVTDPRIERTKRYSLKEVLLSAFIAILDGARSWRDIEFTAELHLDKLREFLPFANGIPSHHTYSRVFQLINPDSLEMAFRQFAHEIIEAIDCDVSIINIDGKQMRGATAAGGVRCISCPLGATMLVYQWDSLRLMPKPTKLPPSLSF